MAKSKMERTKEQEMTRHIILTFSILGYEEIYKKDLKIVQNIFRPFLSNSNRSKATQRTANRVMYYSFPTVLLSVGLVTMYYTYPTYCVRPYRYLCSFKGT